jgi:outer membrane protein assembly factor BamB
MDAILKLLLAVSLVLLINCNHSEKTAWTQFRGPNASGMASPEANPPTDFGEDQNLLWKIDLPVGGSSPVIWDNRIYLTAYVEDSRELKTICIERKTGKILWSNSIFPEKFEEPHLISNPAPATIAADKDGIYVYFASSGIRFFDHEGSLKWEYPIPVPEKVLFGNPSSPVIMDDKLIVNLDYGPPDLRCLLALDKMTGKVIWKTLTQEISTFVNYGYPGYSTPVRLQNQVILHRCGGIAAYSLNDGSPAWWFQLKTNGVGTPIVHDDIIYVSAWMEISEKERRGEYFSYGKFEDVIKDFDQNNNKLIEFNEIPEDLMLFTRPDVEDIENASYTVRKIFNGIDKDKNGLADETEWTTSHNFYSSLVADFGLLAIPAGLNGALSFDDILWMQMEKNPEVPSPLAFGECVFMVKDGGWVTCMDTQTGEVYFQERIGAPGPYIASPVMADDKIYLACYNGTMKVFEAGKTPSVISESMLKGKILATPAIEGKNLYVRTSEHLYAFQE